MIGLKVPAYKYRSNFVLTANFAAVPLFTDWQAPIIARNAIAPMASPMRARAGDILAGRVENAK